MKKSIAILALLCLILLSVGCRKQAVETEPTVAPVTDTVTEATETTGVTEPKSIETRPAETKPVEQKPTEPVPMETVPANPDMDEDELPLVPA